MIHLRDIRAALVVLFVGFFLATFGASDLFAASTPTPRLPCVSFDKAIELDDGSVIAAGSNCVAKLDSSGNAVQSFGDRGSSYLSLGTESGYGTDGGWLTDLFVLDSGFLVVTNRSLIRFLPNGARDSSFGVNGRIDVESIVPQMSHIYGATVGPDESIYFGGTMGSGNKGSQAMVKLQPSGMPDPGFNEDGIYYETGSGHNFYLGPMALDGEGNILVAGGYPTHQAIKVMRMKPDGNVDLTFGADGVGSSKALISSCPGSCTVTVRDLDISGAGQITATGSLSVLVSKYGYSKSVWAKFDIQGTEVTTGSAPGSGAVSVLPDGDLVLLDELGRINPDGSAGFSDDSALSKLSPETLYRGRDVTFNPATGNLTGAGRIAGESNTYCWSPCFNDRGAIAKIDATDGSVSQVFGRDGVTLFEQNECENGEALGLNTVGPWTPCLVEKPEIRGIARILYGRTSRPSIKAHLNLESIADVPRFTWQRLSFTLPDRLTLRRGKIPSKLKVTTNESDAGTFVHGTAGRRIYVAFRPTEFSEEDINYGAPEAAPIDVSIRLDRGAIGPIPKRLRSRPLNFRVKATFEPLTTASKLRWGQNSSVKVLRVRPVNVGEANR